MDVDRGNACRHQQFQLALRGRTAALIRAARHDAAGGMDLADVLLGDRRHDLHPPVQDRACHSARVWVLSCSRSAALKDAA